MRIHVVQKGETLWEIAQKYGVDFNEVVQMNSHLSNPDMIMPGMKIKIPSASKQVKKESVTDKEIKEYPKKEEKKQEKKEEKKQEKKQDKKQEAKHESDKPAAKHPLKDTSPKPIPVIKEDDTKKPVSGKEGLNLKYGDFPKIPMVGQFLESNKEAMKIPDFLKQDATKKEGNKKKDGKAQKEKSDKPKKQPAEMPEAPSQVSPYAAFPAEQQPMPGQHVPPVAMPMQPSAIPMSYCPPVPNNMPMNPVPYPVEYTQPEHMSSYPPGEGVHESPADFYPTQTHPQQAFGLPYAQPGYGQGFMESSSSSMEMPQVPYYPTGGYTNPCGCGGRETIGYYTQPQLQPYGQQQGLPGGYPYSGAGYTGGNYGTVNPYGGSMMPQYPQQYGYYPSYNQGGYQGFSQPGYPQGYNPGYPAAYPFSGPNPMQGIPGQGTGSQSFYRPDDEESE